MERRLYLVRKNNYRISIPSSEIQKRDLHNENTIITINKFSFPYKIKPSIYKGKKHYFIYVPHKIVRLLKLRKNQFVEIGFI